MNSIEFNESLKIFKNKFFIEKSDFEFYTI